MHWAGHATEFMTGGVVIERRGQRAPAGLWVLVHQSWINGKPRVVAEETILKNRLRASHANECRGTISRGHNQRDTIKARFGHCGPELRRSRS